MTPTDWTYEKPVEPGIYAIIYSWDSNEGAFSGYDEWDGKKWDSKYPIFGYAGPFDSIDDADNWARDHDPDW